MLKCIIFLTILEGALGYQDGAPATACDTMVPGHGGFVPKTTPSPYSLVIEDTSNDTAGHTHKYNITITSAVDFDGFLLGATTPTQNYTGQFLSMPWNARKASCGPGATDNDTISAVTHTNQDAKRNYEFEWEPDTDYCGTIVFKLSVAQTYTDFWTDISSPVLNVPCPQPPTNYNSAPVFQSTFWTLLALVSYLFV